MTKQSLFIVMKDSSTASMIKFILGNSIFTTISVCHDPAECFYALGKGKVPDYIVYDHYSFNITPLDFLDQVRGKFPFIKSVFLLGSEDEHHAKQLIQYGASDYILKTSNKTGWIKELVSNLGFLCKSPAL